MSMSDPLGDMLTRIRNGQTAGKKEVRMPSSKLRVAVAKLLQEEGYLNGSRVEEADGKPCLAVELRYFQGKPVIEMVKRVSRPGLRIYKGKKDLPKVQGGLGIAIVSTSKGLMTDRAARVAGEGGEILAYVS
jgi:small subunit ribosomal protein S8